MCLSLRITGQWNPRKFKRTRGGNNKEGFSADCFSCIIRWKSYVADMEVAFLMKELKAGGGDNFYLSRGCHRNVSRIYLNRTVYSLKQSALAFWMELVKALIATKFKRSWGRMTLVAISRLKKF
jgi:hypothetical protein